MTPPSNPLSQRIDQILGELAGAASMCWNPRPGEQIFQPDEAQRFVLEAKQEILKLFEDRSGEPLIHSHLTDVLPDDHKLAWEQVHCDKCHELVHAANNECMQTWLETKWGNFCSDCYPIGAVLEEPE